MSAFWSQFCIEKSRWERESCPLSGIEKRPPLGGYVRIKVVLDTIRNTTVVRCREAVLFSEGPLSEARLYTIYIAGNFRWCKFSHKMRVQLRIKFIKFKFSKSHAAIYSTRVRTTIYDYAV